ncbi:MAG: Gfo/Idh/MocA family protein [Phycisphaeraceae bacterium]
MPRTRIGYVDDDLNNFHADVYLKLLRETLSDRGFEIAGCTALQDEAGRAWAQRQGVPYFENVAALDEAVDCYMVLAPGTPETHLPLCEQVLPRGKPTFVDKTFAPDTATAQRLFELADEHGAPMQSSSALRYTAVQAHARQAGAVRHMVTWGGGRSFDEYAIHPVEMAVSCLGPEVRTLMRRGRAGEDQLLLEFDGDRTAVVNVFTSLPTPFAAAVTSEAGTAWVPVDTDTLFRDALAAILDFFERGAPAVDRAETLAIRRILDAAAKPEARAGFVAV